MGEVHRLSGGEEEQCIRLLNQPRPPIWRSTRHFRRQAEKAKTKPVLLALSSACAVCLIFPDRFDFSTAISFQLAQGSLTARLLFGLMFATLVYVAARLWSWKRYYGAIASGFVIALLAVIASTDARSFVHNATFIGLTGFLVLGHLYSWHVSTDGRVFLTGLGCLAGAAMCPFSLGFAERIIICSTCLTLNIVILEYLD